MRVNRDSRLGFSLMEAMIVVAILAIIATFSVGYLVAARPHAQLERAELQLASHLALARNTAISAEVPVEVVFNAPAGSYLIQVFNRDDASWNQLGPGYVLPPEVSFTNGGVAFPDTTVRFTPRGTLLAGGSLNVISGGETSTLVGNLASGRFPAGGGNLR